MPLNVNSNSFCGLFGLLLGEEIWRLLTDIAIADAPTKGPKFGILTFKDHVEFIIETFFSCKPPCVSNVIC